jgi:hypothetical protein
VYFSSSKRVPNFSDTMVVKNSPDEVSLKDT